jgi:hypothetical protein
MAQEGEPGRTIAIRRRSVMQRKNPTNYILIHRDAEGQGDLLGNARTSPCRITLLHIDNGANYIRVWTCWPRLGSALWRKQQPILSLYQSAMELQHG